MNPDDLATHPTPLAAHYRRFRVAERTLLTGHSHQAWPDVSEAAQGRAWSDAAEQVDRKWSLAAAEAEKVRCGYARLLGDRPERIALAQNTHELVVKLLSALPLAERPRLVTTTGEFHSIRRQLDRLEEEGIRIVRVPVDDADDLADRLADAVDDRTAAAMVSSVLFANARIVPGLDRVAEACRRHGSILLVDAYHHLNVVPFSIEALGLEDAFVTGAGYKYCQLGEGNAFLRFPEHTELRPVVTGWFAEFDEVVRGKGAPAGPGDGARRVYYRSGPGRFAGATYDPVSHYRAAAVFGFFEERGLDVGRLRALSRHQVGLLARRFDDLDVDPRVVTRDRDQSLEATGGFLALRSPHAALLHERLLEEGVHTDFRGEVLRLGPAPYISNIQLEDGVERLGEVSGSLEGGRPGRGRA
jgi:kynureninase